ncbi:50S ribosomal protein L3 [Candidatus Acetothermia bacterium]|nr:MAG: 50S ribosomal protein L3 [Candidatus Acetothermia bacterium]
MARGLLARKIGMTQLFVDGSAVGATVFEAKPCTVVRVKTIETDGYNALQLGYDEVDEKRVTKPLAGHFKKAGVAPHRHLFEVRVDDPENYNVGDVIGVDVFAEGDKIDISGISRGLGFQGVVKRWDFAGGPKSHGSHFHRRPGSVGNCVQPGRVVKGKKLPGHTGARRVTIKGLRVLRVDPERNLLIVKGSTPGPRGAILRMGKRDG